MYFNSGETQDDIQILRKYEKKKRTETIEKDKAKLEHY